MHGILVYWIDDYPKDVGNGDKPLLEKLKDRCKKIPLDTLADAILEAGQQKPVCRDKNPYLRVYIYKQEEAYVLLVFNEHPFECIETDLWLSCIENSRISYYDAVANLECPLLNTETPGIPGWCSEDNLHICLEAGESACFIVKEKNAANKDEIAINSIRKFLDGNWKITGKDSTGKNPDFFAEVQEKETFPNLNGRKLQPRFTGTASYKTELFMESIAGDEQFLLELPEIYDCAKIEVNQRKAGMLYGKPYRLDITGFLKNGKNEVTIHVSNTLVWNQHDRRSSHMQLMPSGILKAPILIKNQIIMNGKGEI